MEGWEREIEKMKPRKTERERERERDKEREKRDVFISHPESFDLDQGNKQNY